MRAIVLALVVAAGAAFTGCSSCNDGPWAFYWNSRLVPVTPNPRIATGTGAVEHVAVAPMDHPMTP
jgi:hypothetical protein